MGDGRTKTKVLRTKRVSRVNVTEDSLFRGYVLTKNKNCIEPFKDVSSLKSYDQVSEASEFAGILAENTVLIDVDDTEQSDILYKLVQDLDLKCRVYQTTRGKHFLFLNNDGIKRNRTNAFLFLGIKCDIKLGSRNSYSVLKFNNAERAILRDFENYDTVPKYLTPTNLKLPFLDLTEGDGRNQELFNYILQLQANDFTVEESRECIRLINEFVLPNPLGSAELETILRDESFKSPSFFKGSTFLFDKFSTFLKNNAHVKKINNRLHVFKDGIYVDGAEEIEREMINHIPNLNRSKRTEVMLYLKLLVEEEVNSNNANLIPFRNGVLDLETDTLLAFNPALIVRNKINLDYNPNAYDELMDKTLDKLACGDSNIRDLIEEMIGYCFYSRNELGKAFILVGDKSNGKSTLLALIEKILGYQNISSLDLGELGERFKTAELFGKLANIGDDIGDEFVADPSLFKKLVTGDRVNVEKKGQDPFEFNNYSKFIFSANKIPRIKDRTGAVQRRLLIIPFNARFSKDDEDFDPFIKYKLQEQGSLEYLIKLGVEGLKRILENKGFTKSEKVQRELDEYEKTNNPILLFFEDWEKEDFIQMSVNDAYRNYTIFCAENNFQPFTKIEFGRNLCTFYNLESFQRKVDGKNVRFYRKVADG